MVRGVRPLTNPRLALAILPIEFPSRHEGSIRVWPCPRKTSDHSNFKPGRIVLGIEPVLQDVEIVRPDLHPDGADVHDLQVHMIPITNSRLDREIQPYPLISPLIVLGVLVCP